MAYEDEATGPPPLIAPQIRRLMLMSPGEQQEVYMKGRRFTLRNRNPTLDGDQKPKGPLRRMGARQRPSTA